MKMALIWPGPGELAQSFSNLHHTGASSLVSDAWVPTRRHLRKRTKPPEEHIYTALLSDQEG